MLNAVAAISPLSLHLHLSRRFRQNAGLGSIPVVILTTSSNPQDLEFCYANGANRYLLKPMSLRDCLRIR